MQLFYSPTSPFARKVRVLIAEKAIAEIELVTVSPFDAPAELVDFLQPPEQGSRPDPWRWPCAL